MIYDRKKLCHHIKHILFYFWSIYGINIVNPIDSYSINLHNGTQFLSHLLRHLWTCVNDPFHKKSTPFSSKNMWVYNEEIKSTK